MDTVFIYAVFKFSFSKKYKIYCFNPLFYMLMVNSMKTSFAQQSYFATSSANHVNIIK